MVTGDRGTLSTRRGRSNLPSPALVASLSPHFAAKLSRETWDFVPWARFKSELAQRRCRPGARSHDIFLEEWVTSIAGRFGFRLSDASALGSPFRPDEMRANCSWAALDEKAAQSNPAGPSEAFGAAVWSRAVALSLCFSSQSRPTANCLKSFRSEPTGSLRARRSASAACFLSGETGMSDGCFI